MKKYCDYVFKFEGGQSPEFFIPKANRKCMPAFCLLAYFLSEFSNEALALVGDGRGDIH